MRKCLIVILSLALLLAACGKKQVAPSWQEQYDLGVRYLSEGNYEEAIIAFTAAIEIDPKQAEAYIGLTEVYTAQGNIEKAIEILDKGIAEIGETAALTEAKANLTQLEPETVPEQTGSRTNRFDHDDGSYSVFEYDAEGKLVRDTIYSADGTMVLYSVLEYDALGNMIQEMGYSADDTLMWIVEYDTARKNMEPMERRYIEYYADGTVNYYRIPEYDTEGNCVRATFYAADGTVYHIDEY